MLIVSMFMLSFETTWAGMIGTEQAMATASAQTERSAMLSLVSRADVAKQLSALGVDPQTARDRVAAMTDEEVHALAGKVAALPAGADSGLAWVLVVVLVAAIVYYVWK